MEATRRQFLVGTGAAGTLALFNGTSSLAAPTKETKDRRSQSKGKTFWPNGARLAISISLMFEGGGQPITGAQSAFGPILDGLPDLPANGFFAYGHYEGIPRALNLFDKHDIKATCFMVGKAIESAPDVAQEVVRRGHEAAAHGRTWSPSYNLSRDEDKLFIADSQETIHRITGQIAIGWNAFYMRNSVHILETLQELGFLYTIDEPSHDEPFIIPVRGKDFVTVPYTLSMNDISSFPLKGYNPLAYEQALKDEFDQLYEEGADRRRMMLVGMHDRINGHPNRIRVLDRFFTYAKGHNDVWFARKDEIAKWVLEHREDTPIVQRGPASISGLQGS